jgi:hypothetical protein
VHWDPAYTAEELAFLMAVVPDGPLVVGEPAVLPAMGGAGSSNAISLIVNARPGLRLRTGPGTEFDVIAVLPLGTRVHPVKTVGTWTLVDLVGDKAADGFLFSDFLVSKGAAGSR